MTWRLALPFLLVVATEAHAADLSAPERSEIDAHVRPCWPHGGDALPASTQVTVSVVTESDGTVIDATGVAKSSGILAGEFGPGERALTAQARQALLDPRCNRLPLPARLLWHRQMFSLIFAP